MPLFRYRFGTIRTSDSAHLTGKKMAFQGDLFLAIFFSEDYYRKIITSRELKAAKKETEGSLARGTLSHLTPPPPAQSDSPSLSLGPNPNGPG